MPSISDLKVELKQLNAEYAKIKDMPAEKRADFGRELNVKKQTLIQQIADAENAAADQDVVPLDITASRDINADAPEFFTADFGSKHPLMTELDRVIAIYQSMGFDIMESVQLDDEFHMFDSLNFAKGHPARDGYDSFRTEEGFIPPAHTSTMQHRVLKAYKHKLDEGKTIAVAVPGRVYRNEDVDATHEHTFYQCEGVYSGIIYYFEQIGETAIDLSNYYTKAQTNAEITNALNTALANYSTTQQMTSSIAAAIANYYTKAQVDAMIAPFITASVNNLVNYYLKSETFTKAEVNQLQKKHQMKINGILK